MFLSGEICSSALPVVFGGAGWLVRVDLMGQKSAEVVVLTGIVGGGEGPNAGN